MSSEHEMLNLIIKTANEDERILAVYMKLKISGNQ